MFRGVPKGEFLEDGLPALGYRGDRMGPPFISHEVWPFERGPTTRSLGDLSTMVINHVLTGMILQVREYFIYAFKARDTSG